MSRVLRLVVAWLLAAALPLQGSVAASMALCGTHGEGAPAARQVHAGHEGHEGHGASDAATTASPGHDHAAGHDGNDPATGHAAGKCSVCAACCAAMAITAADFSLDLAAVSEAYAAPIGTAPPPFLTEGLERPPRASFA